jgi:N,N'-diacetyllegionaminate synthase
MQAKSERRSCYVIAEMACSHEGDSMLAKRIIDAAGASGADAIQFQIWKANKIMSPQHKDYALLQRIELSYTKWHDLYSHAKREFPAMDVIACIYDLDSLDFAHELGVNAYKIHNADLTNPMLVKSMAKTQKRIDLSIGGAEQNEITQCLSWIRSVSNAAVWLMYGLQNFPTDASEINIQYMLDLNEHFKTQIGYQDHSDPEDPAAFWLPAAAVSNGIGVIEKHITHDRSFKGVDHEAALNPDQFRRFVKMIRDLEQSHQGLPFPKTLSQAEIKYRRYARKSALFSRALSAGHQLGAKDLVFLRSDDMGISPHDAEKHVGKYLSRAVSEHEALSEEVLV